MDKRTAAMKSILQAIKKNRDEIESNAYNPAEQVEGYKKRIKGSGLDLEKETDKRNFIEKAFNLPEDQNPLFDFFEIINRPQQALFGGIKEAMIGGDFVEGAKEGLKGDRYTFFKEILHDMGMEETVGTLGLDDVAGFAGDVFIDPMNIPFLGMTKAAKAIKVADATKRVVTTTQALNKAKEVFVAADKAYEATRVMDLGKDLFNTVRAADEAATLTALQRLNEARVALEKAEDAAKVAQLGEKAAKNIKRMASGNDLVMRGIGTGFKKSFRLADSGITNVLKYIDTRYANFAAIQKIDITKHAGALTGYNNIKHSITNVFDFAKSLPDNLFAKVRQVRGKEHLAKNEMMIILEQKQKGIFSKADEVLDRINKSGKFPSVLNRDDLLEYVTILYENGNDVFKGGKVARAGLNRKTSMESLITDESFWTVSGVTKAEADKLEEFMRQYLPDFYDEYVTGNPKKLFTVTEGKDGIVEQYRFTDKEVYKKFVEKFRNVHPKDELSSIKRLTKKQLDELNIIEEDLKVYYAADRAARDSGVNNQKALRRGTPRYKKFTENVDLIDLEMGKRNRILVSLRQLAGVEGSTAVTARKKLSEQLAESNRIIGKALQENGEISQKGMAQLTDLIEEAEASKAAFYKAHSLGEDGVVRGQDMLEAAKEEIVLKHFLTDKKVQELEMFAEQEGVTDILDAIHDFMSSAGEAIRNTMDGGLTISEGYLSHAITPEWQKLKLNEWMNLSKENPWVNPNAVIGNSKSMARRRYQMSTYEANRVSKGYLDHLLQTEPNLDPKLVEKIKSKADLNLFAKDITTSFIDFIDKTTKATGDSILLHEVVAHAFKPTGAAGTFDSKYIIPLEGTLKPPKGYTMVTAETLKRKIDSMGRYIRDNDVNADLIKKVNEYLGANAGKALAIDNNIDMLIGRITDEAGQGAFLNLIDFLTNVFKRNKLLSPGFQLRNIVGNMSNMWLSGMSVQDITKYNKKAYETMKEGRRLFEEVTRGIVKAESLSLEQLQYLNNYREFVGHGFAELGNAIHDIPEHMLNRNRKATQYGAADAPVKEIQRQLKIARESSFPKKEEINRLEQALRAAKKEALPGKIAGSPRKFYDELTRFNMNSNQAQDSNFRMAMYMYAKDNPEFLTKYNYGTPEEAVRRILFDYVDLSKTERDIMRKVIPFYTFTKKNLGYQIANIQKNPGRYARMIRAFNSSWNMLDAEEGELDKFKIENFWVPIPYISEDGKYKAIKTSLPLGDLGEWLDSPFRRALASTSPIARAPFEIALNRQVFSNMPIQEFKGQKGFQIPELGRKEEFALNQLGLDVPVAQGFDVGRTIGKSLRGEVSSVGQGLEEALGRSIMSTGDTVKTAERTAYEELDDMQNLMRYYKQEGIDIVSLAEIENQNRFKGQKATIERLRAIRRGK